MTGWGDVVGDAVVLLMRAKLRPIRRHRQMGAPDA
jgi:hypothetical protein